jgi:Carboxypeptidase regulatory-like domain
MVKGFAVLLVALALATSAFAQGKKTKEPTERAVSGVVTDASGNPVPGAVVQLKNTKTLQIRSFIAKEKGDYYFQGLGMDTDYEIKAESNGKTSATRNISSFDSHPAVTVNLQLK